MTPLLEIRDLSFAWPAQAPLLDIAHFRLEHGEKVFLKGPSGSGKTTFLSLLSGVNVARTGSMSLLGHELSALSSAKRDRLRADHIGYVFQQFNLLPFLSVHENIRLGCGFSKVRSRRACERYGSVDRACAVLMERLGLEAFATHKAAALSIGQQQRVATARALIGTPQLIIADEPTSALDADRRQDFMHLLLEECRAAGAGLLMVSHDASLDTQFDRQLNLADLNRAVWKP